MSRDEPGYTDCINAHNVMLAAIALFSVLFLIMLIGMLIPLLKPGAVLDATWFNERTALPTLVLAMMLGVCLLIPDVAPLRIIGIVIAAILATVLFAVVSPFGNLPIDASTPILGFALLAVFYKIYITYRAGSRSMLRRISPHIIHLGIVLILIGVVVSTNIRIDGSEVIREGTIGTYAGQPYAVKVTGIASQYEGAPYGEYPGSSYVTQVDFELYSGDRLIDRDEVKYITDFKWGQSYATNYVYRSLTREVFITTKMTEGDLANLYMRTAPWITAVWGGIIIMSVGIVLLMYTVRTQRAAQDRGKKDGDGKGGKEGKSRDNRGGGDKKGDIDQKYERLLRTELDRTSKQENEEMKTIVIGGGLTGLAAAYKLLKNGISDVTILEKNSELGGMAASYHIDDYHIEKYYHHIFESDTELISLMTDLGLGKDLQWLKGTTGYHIDGKIYPMNTPLELLRSPLSILDLMRLAAIVLVIKRKKDVSGFDDVTARGWIIENAGNSVYERFFEPLLRSKFGNNHARVSAAWLFGRIRIRSNRSASGERLGYLRGGFYRFIKRLTDSITRMGGEVMTGCEVSEIRVAGGAVCGVYMGAGEYMKPDCNCNCDRDWDCDVVISTVSPHALSGLVRAGTVAGAGSGFLGMPDIPYQGTACALFGMDKPLLNNTYWLNIKSDVPFGAVVEHTNFLPVADYGEHLVYVTAYLQDADDPRWWCTEQEVIDSYISGLERLFPDFSKNDVHWWRIARHIDTAPVYLTGYARNIPPYSTDLAGLYLAGMFSDANYPERSMNGSILAGFGCAEEIVGDRGSFA